MGSINWNMLHFNSIFSQNNEDKTTEKNIKEYEDSHIKITFENSSNMSNLNLCHKYNQFLNPDKDNKLEKYLIFTTKFQINLLTKCNQILIDGTFKSCPKNFYQINVDIKK